MTRLVTLGPPGSGKGTQARLLADSLNVPAISTGDLFRAAAADDSELGRSAGRYIATGRLVPDTLTNAMVLRRISASDAASGFILDGFPRTAAQAIELDAMLLSLGHRLDGAVALGVDDEEIRRRLSGRRTCRSCAASWHVTFHPTRREGYCDRCGGELYQRADDSDAVIRARLHTYHTHSAPLLRFYAESERLVEVDAAGTMNDVAALVVEAVSVLLDRERVAARSR